MRRVPVVQVSWEACEDPSVVMEVLGVAQPTARQVTRLLLCVADRADGPPVVHALGVGVKMLVDGVAQAHVVSGALSVPEDAATLCGLTLGRSSEVATSRGFDERDLSCPDCQVELVAHKLQEVAQVDLQLVGDRLLSTKVRLDSGGVHLELGNEVGSGEG